ncbi:MAG: AmmeMemoRadiSam system protein B [Patescibacteria group bacterium]|jgi:poly-gamma-glutamate synthesis protein (capsule biosynthesis protein)
MLKTKYPLYILVFCLMVGGFFLISIYRKPTISLNTNSSNLIDLSADTVSAKISTLIVPHHDLVAEKRAKLFELAMNYTDYPDTIILVSTNHFDTGSYDILTTDKTWNLASGKLRPDSAIIASLVKKNLVAVQETAFAGEHGIANILPDIYLNFPDSEIVPIIIKPKTEKVILDNLLVGLNEACINNCLLVDSVDFSHYQPASLAQIHDDFTIRALNNLDESSILKSEVDSVESLYLGMKWAEGKNAKKFNLVENTNSGVIASDRDVESTSYVFGWYEQGIANKKIEDSVSFTIGGDMMFDRLVDYTFRGDKIFDIFSNLGDRTFWGTDLAIANLEGPISATPIPADGTRDSLVFNFPPKTTDVLLGLHFNALSLANNHALNHGKSGFENTIKVLNEAGIRPIGSQNTFDETSVAEFGLPGKKISVITIESLEVSKNLTEVIQAEKAKGNKVLVFPHWGTEYEPIHSIAQAKLAYAWIDAGADIVIGSHPHVIQDAEIYKGKPIFYSLGNLLFDQTFSAPTQHGLIIAGEFKGDNLSLVLLPTVQNKLKPELLTGQEKTDFITKMRGYLNLPVANQGLNYDKIEISI